MTSAVGRPSILDMPVQGRAHLLLVGQLVLGENPRAGAVPIIRRYQRPRFRVLRPGFRAARPGLRAEGLRLRCRQVQPRCRPPTGAPSGVRLMIAALDLATGLPDPRT